MRNRDNPLKNIPPGSFTIIQASHAQFHRYLADIPVRYPHGRITYINNHRFVPLVRFSEEHQDRLDHLVISTLPELLAAIESDRSAILFIEHKAVWFGVDTPDLLLRFTGVCTNRARNGGPVVVITSIMDRELLALDGKADYFFQVGKIPARGRAPASPEQKELDEFVAAIPGVAEKRRLYGQVKLAGW
jgi:hypothetical protein